MYSKINKNSKKSLELCCCYISNVTLESLELDSCPESLKCSFDDAVKATTMPTFQQERSLVKTSESAALH